MTESIALEPTVKLGEFALLKVVAVEEVGAFLDWGMPKDLFLPYAEQTEDLKSGDEIIIYTYLDKAERVAASMRLNRNKATFPMSYKAGDIVDLLIAARTDLGFKAIIDSKHIGVLFKNEVFQELSYGQKIKGYIKALRPDGKVDLSLQSGTTGHKAAAGIDEKILELLNAKEGFLPIHDKTPSEYIHGLFGVSKKKYKIALGALYKKRLITISDDGIRLIKK
ncbi:MAG: S1-like domain-containing RNA-binding protein [Bdellovibrionota bacterium]